MQGKNIEFHMNLNQLLRKVKLISGRYDRLDVGYYSAQIIIGI